MKKGIESVKLFFDWPRRILDILIVRETKKRRIRRIKKKKMKEEKEKGRRNDKTNYRFVFNGEKNRIARP